MTVAAFDQAVSLLLLDKAVFYLKKHQQIDSTGLKDTAAIIKALPLYNIQEIYVEKESLSEMGLNADSLDEAVIQMSRNQVGVFFTQFDLVLTA